MKKTIIIIIVGVILVIAIGVFVALELNKKSTPVVSDEIQTNTTDDEIKNEVNNTEDDVEQISEDIEQGEKQEQEEIEENEEEPEKEAEEVPTTDLEKAINIVKENWGKDDASVYYAEDGKTSKGEYIICVRDKNTTSALAWYIVDVVNGTFTKD